MPRLNQLLEVTTEETIKQIGRDIEEIKGIQFLGGDSITPQILQTANPFDFLAQLDGSDWVIALEVEFTARNQLNPYLYLFLQLFSLDGTPLPTANVESYQADLGGGGVVAFVNNGRETAEVSAAADVQFKGKILLFASDRGSASIVPLLGTII